MALQSLGYDHTVHARTHAGDENLLVKFYMDLVEDTSASKKQGRPIFKEVEWIDIRIPGSRDTRVRPARDKDKQRFPQHYAAFKARTAEDGEEVVGTPLEIWPVISASQAAEMRFFNIRTVENLAGAPDSLGEKFMGFSAIKTKAAAFLEAAKGAAPILALQERVEQLEATNQRLSAEMKGMNTSKKDSKG
jgi:hypothetical protein